MGLSFVDLYPYQQDGVRWLAQGGRRLLGDAPGLGKTPQALLAAVSPVLVVAASTLHGQWKAEAQRWAPDLDVTVSTYQGIVRRKGRKIVKGQIKPEVAEVEWGTVIADEATKLKGRDANVSRVFAKLAKQVPRVYLLSGTPIPNWAHEIFQLLRIMHPGNAEFSSYWRWAEKWFKIYSIDYGHGPVRTFDGLHDHWTWDDFAAGNYLDQLYLGRTKEEHLPDLPPVTITPMPVKMKGEQKRIYDALKADYVAWAESGTEVAAWSDGALHTKLLQAATGVGAVMPGEEGPAVKVETAVALSEEVLPVVCFCNYRSSVHITVQAFEKAGYSARWIMGGMKPEEIDIIRRDFQDGKIDALVGTYAMMSEGLTLHRANTAFMIERNYRPDLNQQAIDRLHRIGQERPVNIIELYCEGSVDEMVRELLDAKTAETGAAMAAIRKLSARQFAAMLQDPSMVRTETFQPQPKEQAMAKSEVEVTKVKKTPSGKPYLLGSTGDDILVRRRCSMEQAKAMHMIMKTFGPVTVSGESGWSPVPDSK